MSGTNGEKFYSNLPIVDNFFDASNRYNYHPLPDNWYVAITDIVNSAEAINQDRYKTVNILGASPIVGILNLTHRDEIPYTFGGDGSIFCVPPGMVHEARKVLGGSRQIGKVEYNLDLRAAIIPVSYIRDQGYDVRVARYKASDYYIQAIFSGGGLSYAEELLKGSGIGEFRVDALRNAESVDFSGLECRWQEVQQRNKEVLTLLVKSNPAIDNPEEVYTKVLKKMRQIFGFDNKTNPIDVSQLGMTMSFSDLLGETKFHNFGKSWFKRITYLLKVQLQTLIGKILIALDHETSATDWSLYKPDMARNSDHRKFDDMLRVVISGSRKERQQLVSFLQERFEQSQLAYGIHVTNAAVITCMVFQYHREHVHFVDGSGGGYVSASKELKQRLNKLDGKSA